MNIERLKLGEIVPYKKNNRKHSEIQIERIARSIQEFGFNQPICIDENNEILVGHGRLLAAQKLGLKDAPIVRLNDLTEEQKRAYRILDNKLQNDSEWDFDSLSDELDFLQSNGVDLESWGLDDLRAMFPEEDIEIVEDEGPGDLPKETYIKRGDWIELGQHRFCCDSSIGRCPFDPFDLVVTDPPYGVSYVGKTKDALTLENDDLTKTELSEMWNKCLSAFFPLLKEGGVIYAAVPAGPLRHVFVDPLRELGVLRQELVWLKDSLVLGRSDYHYIHEPILYGWKPGAAHYVTASRDKTSVLSHPRPKASREHPTMKPLSLWGELISNSSRQGERVYDPFLGSGTTLIACEQLGRICYGMEIEPRYCQVIIERYKKYCEQNGKKFECKINGQAFIPPPDEKEAS